MYSHCATVTVRRSVSTVIKGSRAAALTNVNKHICKSVPAFLPRVQPFDIYTYMVLYELRHVRFYNNILTNYLFH